MEDDEEYVPSTEEVRERYMSWDYITDRCEQFDRWLAQTREEAWAKGYAAGTSDERTHQREATCAHLGWHTPNPYRASED